MTCYTRSRIFEVSAIRGLFDGQAALAEIGRP